MTVTVSRLNNGLRVVTHAMPHLETASLGVWVASGARHETFDEHGISHLLEHMAFKGTAKRSALDIAEEIEQVGGELNAATSVDTTCYYARVPKGDLATALDLISDIVQHPSYAEDELERERDVILQEIAATRDSPDDIAYDLLQEAAFPDQSLGRSIIGTPESVSRFTAADLRAFLATHYRAGSMVLAAAGNIDHEALVRHAEALFGGLNPGDSRVPVPARYVGGARLSGRPFEQAHALLGYQGFSYIDPLFYAAQVFSGLFGGGMSSRLFQEIREKRGLCYSIYSSAWGLRDTGLLSIHAATGADTLDELVDVLRVELGRAADSLPSEREVLRAKAQIRSSLLMSLEGSLSRAEQMARQVLAFDRVVPTEELIERIEVVTPGAIRDAVQRVLEAGAPSCALVGAGDCGQRVADRAVQKLTA